MVDEQNKNKSAVTMPHQNKNNSEVTMPQQDKKKSAVTDPRAGDVADELSASEIDLIGNCFCPTNPLVF